MIPARVSLALVALLLILRAVMAVLLPLSADEAYYWLWSKHLAAGYFDHPPMIAWLIRAGTLLLGDTAAGVRLMGVLLSLPASWFVWQAARLIIGEVQRFPEIGLHKMRARFRGGEVNSLRFGEL